MVLRMPCPTKRSGSDNWYYRRTIPADVQSILATMPKSQRPAKWHKTHIVIPLGTSDRNAAKARCSEVSATVEKQIEALRAGPKPLNNKQLSALSGELYRAFADGLEANPVLSAEQWLRIVEVNEAARRGDLAPPLFEMGIGRTEEDKRRVSMERRFGPWVDSYLAKEGRILTPADRDKLIERTSVEFSAAAKKLARNADGDYSPDAYAARFPKFEETPSEGRSLQWTVNEWHKDALNRNVKERDAKRIKGRFEKLIEFLGHDDATRVTKKDIFRWKDQRRATVTGKTIDDSDIASFKNVFNFAVDREWLAANPTDGTTDKGKKKKQAPSLREEYFTREEAKALLVQAAIVTGSRKEKAKTTAAKRWVPWLCAYSGARVAEMIQLRKKDVRNDPTHGWVIRLTPEAGSIKNNKFCDVPVHEHLIATGFIDFVNNAANGHLFVDPAKNGNVDGPVEGVYKRIYKMAREVITDPNVQPLHAWRYTFKTYGLEADIEPLTLDAISNHAPRTQGEAYTKVTLKTRAAAMAKFPRYPT